MSVNVYERPAMADSKGRLIAVIIVILLVVGAIGAASYFFLVDTPEEAAVETVPSAPQEGMP